MPNLERQQQLLKLLIEQYIREGQPVASKTLAQKADLSSATIRNVMAELEDHGLIMSPHTSAGRIPTQQGYRAFVDTLLTVSPLESQISQQVSNTLETMRSPSELITAASQLLSEVTSMASVVMVPKRNAVTLRQIEFLPLSNDRVLAVMIVNEEEVQNRVIHTGRTYRQEELQQAANFINQRFAGQALDGLREDLIRTMRSEKEQMDSLMMDAMSMTEEVLSENADDADCVISGESHLVSVFEESGLQRLQSLMQAFGEKRDILQLMDACLDAEGIQIFIGEESGYQAFENCSVITSPYRDDEQAIFGVLAVVGPTRMHYDRIIPCVDLTAKVLSAALNHSK